MKLAKSLYELSINDIESSEILYRSKKYSNSIFLFQQAVEKLVKAFGLTFEIITPKKLRKVSHRPHKVYNEAITKKSSEITKIEELKLIFPNFFDQSTWDLLSKYKADIKTNESKLNNINLFEYFDLTLEDIDLLIEKIYEEKETAFKLPENYIERLSKSYANFAARLKKVNNQLSSDLMEISADKELVKKIGSALEDGINLEMKVHEMNIALFILSLITSPHEAESRYPCEDCGDSPLIYYNNQLPLIIRFPSLVNIFKNCLIIFEYIFDNKFENQITGS